MTVTRVQTYKAKQVSKGSYMAEKEKHQVLLNSWKTSKYKDIHIVQHFSSGRTQVPTEHLLNMQCLATHKQNKNLKCTGNVNDIKKQMSFILQQHLLFAQISNILYILSVY
jgi:hypothetical protein